MNTDSVFDKKKYYIVAIVASALAITYLHFSTLPAIHALHNIYAELHYIPIIMGAVAFGLRGAVLTFLLVSLLHLAYLFQSGAGTPLSILENFVQLLFSGFIALLAGFLVGREKKYRKQSEKDRYLAGLGQVAATIVHDLKTPLAVISGFAKRIQAGKGNSGAVQAIADASVDMQRIVHDVLDFAKPIRLELGEEDIKDIVRRVCDQCRMKAEAEGITLSIDVPADPVSMTVDSFHMERALVNLVNNALDASRKGRDVDVSVVTGKEKLIIAVRDHGSGMDRETLENIFIPFYTRKTTGTGLGMSIAKKIVEGHKGRIDVKSRPEKGTEVRIELPYRAGQRSG